MAEAVIFHYRDADNLLTRLNPNAKLLALLSYSIVVSSAPPAVVLPLALLPLLTALAVHLPWRGYLRESLFFIVIAVAMGMTAILSGDDCLEAAASSVSFLSMVLSSILLTDSTMPDELSRSLGAALSHVIGRLGYSLASALEITLSMIPLIIDGSISMYESYRARGASFSSHPLRLLCQLSVSMLSSILDKAEMYIDALYSRGYDASKRRASAPYRMRDWLVIAISIAVPIMALIHPYLR